jgi:hypothetical protein
MATKILFINMEYLRSRSTVEGNVDYDKVKPFIIKSQDLYLQQRLGSKFFKHLVDAVIFGTLTPAEEELIDTYIKPMVAEYTYYEALPFLNFKLTNKAISKQNSDNSQSSDIDEIKYLRNILKNNAEFYDNRLYKHLSLNADDFKIWKDNDKDQNIMKNDKVYSSGMYLPKQKKGGGVFLRKSNRS